MSDADLMKLYSARILGLAAEIPFTDRLDAPHTSVKKRAPLCGSTIEVDINITDGRISAFGQDVKACALGQAAASVVAGSILGRNRSEMEIARDQLRAMLVADGPVPDAPFGGLEVLLPARDYKNRHASIMLALDAVSEALENLNA